MATVYVYPYTGLGLSDVIDNADADDTIILTAGVHLLEVPNTEYGIALDKDLTIEGHPSSGGVLPIIEVYNTQKAKKVFYTNDNTVSVFVRRIIFRHWGQRSVVNPATLRYLFSIEEALAVQFEQVGIIGPSYPVTSGNKPAGIFAGDIESSGVLIRNCTFVNLNVAMKIGANAGQCLVNDSIFQNIHEYVMSMGNGEAAIMNYCNFDICPSPRHELGIASSVTENNCTVASTRMYGSKSMSEGIYNVNREAWEEQASPPVFGLLGLNRAAFAHYDAQQGPNIYLVKKTDVSINSVAYRHIYVGTVTCFREGEQGGQRPALKWKQGGNWYSETWGWNAGYIFNNTIQDLGRDGVLYGTPLLILHKYMPIDHATWQGTITQLTYVPFNEVDAASALRWAAVGFIIVSEYEFTRDDVYEKLTQLGFGYLLPTDSQLINSGSPGIYDDWMGPWYDGYIGRLGPLHDLGAYGGVSTEAYVPERPFFETLYPPDEYTLLSLPYVSIHLKQSPITYAPVDWSSIQVEAFGNIYTQASPSDSNATLTLSGDVTDTLITLTLTDILPDDPFAIVFRGADSTGEGADPYGATYYLWAGKGTMANPFRITPSTGIMAYENPKLILGRWAHCYDQIQVGWSFEDEQSEVVRGLPRGERKILELTDNPLIQTSNLGGHTADLLLKKLGQERKEITQTLPFAPFIDPYDILRLLYPSKHYLVDRERKWVTSELRLSPKTGKIQFKGLESHES